VPDLTAAQFPAFFEAVYGTEPFIWQQRLLERVLDTGRWPDVIDLPTGVGKTAALDIACFALACAPESFPRRIVFVIDRRLVVNQVVARGIRLKGALDSDESIEVRRVADRLRSVAGGREPLHVSGLRGGVVIDAAWARWPNQPCLIVSTVDQFGSRLLFRGYGVRDGMRPVHAGLAGGDCLVLLDEVHMSRPFAETLRSIATRYRPGPALPDRWQVVEMSATPGEVPADTELFQLQDGDLEPEITQRVRARKSAELVEAGRPKQEAWEVLPAVVDDAVSGLPARARSIGVVVNRVRSARSVADYLRERGHQVTLLTGRMRPFDREHALGAIDSLVDPDRPETDDESRSVVVATQCIEVGADFSFDALLTECAPVDALRQRFGRLDRRGGASARLGEPSRAVVIGVNKDLIADDDPIYGKALAATWRALRDRHGDAAFDVGPLSTDLPTNDIDLLAPSAQAPLLLPSHLDAFVQTSPRLRIGPEPGPFLHGLDADRDTDVRVVWRADVTLGIPLPGVEVPQGMIERLAFCPPRAEEAMPVPIRAARAWLAQHDEVPVADTENSSGEAPDSGGRAALRWRGSDDVTAVTGVDLRPGDVLVVPSDYGGISAGNWDPTSASAVDDFGDRAQLAHGHRITLRLDPRVLPHGVPPPPTPGSEYDQSVSDTQVVADWIDAVSLWQVAADAPLPDWFEQILRHMRADRVRVARVEDPAAYVVICDNVAAEPTVDADLLDGSDLANSFTGTGITLRAHLEGVGETARSFAESLGFSRTIREDLELAGRLHDLGKADPRFQLLLHRGDEVAAICAAEPLAKSRSDVPTFSGAAARTYPRGMRHELLSVALAESCSELLDTAHDRDLVLHLVASHHGLCRPLPQSVHDIAPLAVEVDVLKHRFSASSDLRPESVGVASAERFWRVVEHYGWYGTAWIEAVFRLADHRRSEAEAALVGQARNTGVSA